MTVPAAMASLEDPVEAARKVLAEHPLCDSCLGRLFGLAGYGFTNAERGRALKTLLLMKAYDVVRGLVDREVAISLARTGFKPAEDLLQKLGVERPERQACYICGGLMERVSELAAMCVEAGKEYEHETFQVGCRVPEDISEREEKLWLAFQLSASESIKSEITREVGKLVQSATGKRYSLKDPDVVFVIDVGAWSVSVISRPVYIYGRYRKLVRGLPQNPWLRPPDPRVAYQSSIEELVTGPLVRLYKAESAKLHAAGREDVDVRTLGNGRPFVVEIRNPKVRNVDLKLAQDAVNRAAQGLVEVELLYPVSGKLVPKLKAYAEIARKTYVAVVKLSQSVDPSKVEALEKALSGAVVSQRTPSRILGRKPDKVRKKVVYSVKARLLSPDTLELTITCQGGLYVKELLHGDGGRTKPSVAEILGVDVEVKELDIVWIEEPAAIASFARRSENAS